MATTVDDVFAEAETLKEQAAAIIKEIQTFDDTQAYYESKVSEFDTRLSSLRQRTRNDIVMQTLEGRGVALRSKLYGGLHTCVILVNVTVLILLIAVLALYAVFPGSTYS